MHLPHQTARLFKALCDAHRVQIVQLLRGGEMCACHLQQELQIGQSTLSHHMKILCDSGLVCARKEGRWMHYSLKNTGLREMQHYISALLETQKKNPL